MAKTILLQIFFFIFLLHFDLISTLICPIYSSRQSNVHQHRYIRHCQTNCSFETIRDHRHSCFGIFYEYSGEMFIKQLGIVHRDELCSKSNECLLEVDELNREIFTCCCSTDNCTLTWRKLERTTTTTTVTHFHLEQNRFSWRFFFVIIGGVASLIFIVIGFVCFLRWCRTRQENSSTDKSIGKSSSIENLFHSAEQLVLGKNSVVYKTVSHDENVVLKVYQNTHVAIWTNETSLLKSIKHESIIKILSDGQFDSNWFLVLPFYENGTLQTFLRTSNRMLTMNECLHFMRSLASAIAYLHLGQNSTGSTIVHRDIKSSNILIGDNGRKLCLTDFGMAAALPRILKEKDFVQIGTKRYMAPELLEGVIAHRREALCSVDMYALSLVLWEIFSQTDVFLRTPYRSPYDEYLINVNDRSAFSRQLYQIVVTQRLRPTLDRPLSDVRYANIVDEIRSLIEDCWIAEPDLRLNAQALLQKLDQIRLF